jgi:hypothetical protein
MMGAVPAEAETSSLLRSGLVAAVNSGTTVAEARVAKPRWGNLEARKAKHQPPNPACLLLWSTAA